LKKYDVIVAGGGPAGVAAALAAARMGVNTLLVARYGFLGGMATAGLVHHFDPINIIEVTGIPKEIYEKLKSKNAVKEFPIEKFEMPYSFWEGGCGFDPEIFKCLADELLEEAGVNFLLHSLVTGVIKEGRQLKGITVENKSGRQEILGKIIVDATGDGDVAAKADISFEKGDKNGVCMSPTLCFRVGGVDTELLMKYLENNPEELGLHPRLGKYIRNPRRTSIIQGFRKLIEKARKKGDLAISLPEPGIGMVRQPREGEFHINATRSPGIDGTKVEDLTRAERLERKNICQLVRFMRKYIPGFENAYLIETATQIGIRETRRIIGDYVLTLEDIKKGKKFGDAVVTAKWAHMDIHSGKDMQWNFSFIQGPYQVPYRCLVVRDAENLLVAGRCFSATREAMASIRIMPICMATGQGAGTAAAISISLDKDLREIKGEELQEKLRKQGVKV